MTANSGTPMTMPKTPHNPPNRMMVNSTQKLDRPVRSPRIFGPMTLPSSCCSARTKTTNQSALMGLSIRISSVEGTAPMMGPKNGITLVMPTTAETSSALGNRKIVQPM